LQVLKDEFSQHHFIEGTKFAHIIHNLSLILTVNTTNIRTFTRSKPLNSALDILSDALRLYGSEQLFASYNGGKDAVVVLHLLRAVAAKRTSETGVFCNPEQIYFAVKVRMVIKMMINLTFWKPKQISIIIYIYNI
jgi:3'-phosphoadenosine 5'-phosphosulfate sulfotransferase (PAPS reductase)/FAD synthetase